MHALARVILPDRLDVEVLARRAEILPNILKIPVALQKSRDENRRRTNDKGWLNESDTRSKLIEIGIRGRLNGIGIRGGLNGSGVGKIEIDLVLDIAEDGTGPRRLQ